MRQQQPRNWLMALAAKALKYLLLSLAGCTIAYVASAVLEISFVSTVAVVILEQILVRASILVVCLIAIAAMVVGLATPEGLDRPRGPSLNPCGTEHPTDIDLNESVAL